MKLSTVGKLKEANRRIKALEGRIANQGATIETHRATIAGRNARVSELVDEAFAVGQEVRAKEAEVAAARAEIAEWKNRFDSLLLISSAAGVVAAQTVKPQSNPLRYGGRLAG